MYYSTIDTHVTTQQDTIYKIACKFYFRWYLWKIIYDYNRDILGADPYNIPAGVSINIIGLNTEPITHTIREDETWTRLSKDYWGTERHWIDIAIANEWKHLVEGETCIIPALVTKKNITTAEDLRRACA